MNRISLSLFSMFASGLLAGCGEDDDAGPWEQGNPIERVESFHVDGQPAALDDMDREFKEELNAALLEDEQKDVKHRAATCTVSCSNGRAMTCSGSAGCAAGFDHCSACDHQDEGDGLDCWTYTCGGAGISPDPSQTPHTPG